MNFSFLISEVIYILYCDRVSHQKDREVRRMRYIMASQIHIDQLYQADTFYCHTEYPCDIYIYFVLYNNIKQATICKLAAIFKW